MLLVSTTRFLISSFYVSKWYWGVPQPSLSCAAAGGVLVKLHVAAHMQVIPRREMRAYLRWGSGLRQEHDAGYEKRSLMILREKIRTLFHRVRGGFPLRADGGEGKEMGGV